MKRQEFLDSIGYSHWGKGHYTEGQYLGEGIWKYEIQVVHSDVVPEAASIQMHQFTDKQFVQTENFKIVRVVKYYDVMIHSCGESSEVIDQGRQETKLHVYFF